MADHVKVTHEGCQEEHCNVCNLFICSICGGAEGTLTKECCRYGLGHEMLDLVFKGYLDYFDGTWWTIGVQDAY